MSRSKIKEKVYLNTCFSFNGVSKTVKQWAAEYKIAGSTLRARLRVGIPIDKALVPPHKGEKWGNLINVEMTVAEWAEYAGINRYTLYTRLANGMPPREAITKEVKIKNSRSKKGA